MNPATKYVIGVTRTSQPPIPALYGHGDTAAAPCRPGHPGARGYGGLHHGTIGRFHVAARWSWWTSGRSIRTPSSGTRQMSSGQRGSWTLERWPWSPRSCCHLGLDRGGAALGKGWHCVWLAGRWGWSCNASSRMLVKPWRTEGVVVDMTEGVRLTMPMAIALAALCRPWEFVKSMLPTSLLQHDKLNDGLENIFYGTGV